MHSVKTLDFEGSKTPSAEGFFFDKLLTVGLSVLDLVELPGIVKLNDDVLASPCIETEVPKVYEVTGREAHCFI